MPRISTTYDMTYLTHCLERDNATLAMDRLNNLTNKSRISFRCACGKEGHKIFRIIASKTGAFCSECRPHNNGKPRTAFSLEFLNECIKRDNATLLETPTGTSLQLARIKFRCACGNDYEKMFRQLALVSGAFCLTCARYKGQPVESVFDMKRLQQCMERDGATYIESEPLNRGARITFRCNCGVIDKKVFQQLANVSGAFCHVCKTNKSHDKAKITNLQKYGVQFTFQSENNKTKSKQSMLEKYGVDRPMRCSKIKHKTQGTCRQRYGFDHYAKSDQIKLKIRATNMSKYGVPCTFQMDGFRLRAQHTILAKYGCTHTTQCKEVQQKMKETCLRKYGVVHPCHSPDIFDRSVANSYRRKIHTFPSGNKVVCQGFEPGALERLVRELNIPENEIFVGAKNVPTIWYDWNDKRRRHYVDIYVKSKNLCVEVKSTFTFKLHQEQTLAKQAAAKELGYMYEIWVYKKANQLQVILN